MSSTQGWNDEDRRTPMCKDYLCVTLVPWSAVLRVANLALRLAAAQILRVPTIERQVADGIERIEW